MNKQNEKQNENQDGITTKKLLSGLKSVGKVMLSVLKSVGKALAAEGASIRSNNNTSYTSYNDVRHYDMKILELKEELIYSTTITERNSIRGNILAYEKLRFKELATVEYPQQNNIHQYNRVADTTNKYKTLIGGTNVGVNGVRTMSALKYSTNNYTKNKKRSIRSII